ncbi:MAG: hypothetical protein AAF639_14445 [Chloroflexota bacterium]
MKRANVKPLTHWVIYKKYTMRFTGRRPELVTGVLTTPEGACEFEYDPVAMRITLLTTNETIHINEYGWETIQKEVGE